ncbi:sporulation stage II, protein E [Neorhodopirellula lusitana]|uniref:sporulation stage II, protein E n=1 Tax=Neorhodopirellula lusitana TaxID=445327 RepID=UPI00384CFD6A
MSTPPPSYLKVLRPDRDGDSADDQKSTLTATRSSHASHSKSARANDQVVEGFWQAYSDATGIRIDAGSSSKLAAASSQLDTATPETTSDTDRTTPVALSEAAAQELGKAAQELADQLKSQQELVRSQQVELAARAAVLGSHRSRLALGDQIDQVLSDAVSATGTSSAAIYMLDELTEQLSTRFVYGLSPVQRLGTSRPLRGARIDLESMIQGVVAVDDLNAGSRDLYRAPEMADSGICVCLGDVDLPIGTLWLFGDEAQEFTNMQTASARLAAALVSNLLETAGVAGGSGTTHLSVAGPDADIEVDTATEEIPGETFAQIRELDEVRMGEFSDNVAVSPQANPSPATTSATTNRWSSELSNWQHDTLPLGQQLAPEWSVDGMIESPLSIAQSWHHWDVLPDGVMTMAMCQQPAGDITESQESIINLTSTLDATVARAALQAHTAYRHSPGDAVMRILDTLLQVRDGAIDDTGQPNMSLFYAHVDPDTGHACIASVGDWSTLVVSKYGFRPVGMSRAGDVRPNEFMGRQTAAIRETMLQPGEVLLVTGREWMGTRPDTSMSRDSRNQSAQNRIGAAIQQALREGERSPLSAIRRLLASSALTCERTAMSLHYLDNLAD